MGAASKRVPPHNLEAEESLLGACTLNQEAMNTASKLVTPADFYNPAHAEIFISCLNLHTTGQKIDLVTLSADLSRRNQLDAIGGSSTLLTLQTRTPATSNASRYAKIVVELAMLRRIIGLAAEISDSAYETPEDPNEIIERFVAELAGMGITIGDVPNDLWQLDAYLDRPDMERAPWCIPGLLRVGWRIMLVAGEGIGKTVLLRQIAICAAQGIHPLSFEPMDPCRTLIVDLENPQDSVVDVCNPIRSKALNAATTDYDPDRAWLWWRPSGINLRRRTDRLELEAVIAHVQPDLVCLGPLYKAYEVGARENDELAAREVMVILDDLRTRYSFGLMLEHHAPKESGGHKRKLMPYGSSFWLRWPEIGLNLTPEGESMRTLNIGRWRGDRLVNSWPSKIHRSDTWPWVGEWPDQDGGWSPPNNPRAVPVNDFLDDEDEEGDEDGYILEEPF